MIIIEVKLEPNTPLCSSTTPESKTPKGELQNWCFWWVNKFGQEMNKKSSNTQLACLSTAHGHSLVGTTKKDDKENT